MESDFGGCRSHSSLPPFPSSSLCISAMCGNKASQAAISREEEEVKPSLDEEEEEKPPFLLQHPCKKEVTGYLFFFSNPFEKCSSSSSSSSSLDIKRLLLLLFSPVAIQSDTMTKVKAKQAKQPLHPPPSSSSSPFHCRYVHTTYIPTTWYFPVQEDSLCKEEEDASFFSLQQKHDLFAQPLRDLIDSTNLFFLFSAIFSRFCVCIST